MDTDHHRRVFYVAGEYKIFLDDAETYGVPFSDAGIIFIHRQLWIKHSGMDRLGDYDSDIGVCKHKTGRWCLHQGDYGTAEFLLPVSNDDRNHICDSNFRNLWSGL